MIKLADRERLDELWSEAAASYIEAVEQGTRAAWIQQRWPDCLSISHAEVISDLCRMLVSEYEQIDVICPQCQRLWRQDEPGSSSHHSYLPEQ